MSIDIVFSMDSTGSQFPIFRELQRRVVDTINHLFEIPNLRIGLIAHGDYNDSPYSITTLPLTTDKDALVRFVKTVEQTNGFGNGGEQYENVLHEVGSFNWQADKRAFVMLGDEPAHEKGTLARSYAPSHRVTVDWREEAQQLQKNGITCYMVRCQNRSDSRLFHSTLSKIWSTPLLSLAQFSDIERLIFALTYKQDSNERLEQFQNELETSGGLNRNLAQIIDQLLGKAVDTPFEPYTLSTARTLKHRFSLPDGLVPVEPSRFQMLHVDTGTDIKSFVQSTGARFQKGKGFYELTKSEEVQESKEVVLRHKKSGDMFTGKEARQLINLPYGSRGKVKPDRSFEYDVFVQSTSVNRKLVPDTRFLYEVEMY